MIDYFTFILNKSTMAKETKTLAKSDLVPYGADKHGNALFRSRESAEAEQNLAEFFGISPKPSGPCPPSNVRNTVVIIGDSSAN